MSLTEYYFVVTMVSEGGMKVEALIKSNESFNHFTSRPTLEGGGEDCNKAASGVTF